MQVVALHRGRLHAQQQLLLGVLALHHAGRQLLLQRRHLGLQLGAAMLRRLHAVLGGRLGSLNGALTPFQLCGDIALPRRLLVQGALPAGVMGEGRGPAAVVTWRPSRGQWMCRRRQQQGTGSVIGRNYVC